MRRRQKKEKEQYAAMKKRIKYMYEAGNDSAFETLVTSDDFTDLLSKAEYVQNVHSYDRKQLQEYVETKQQISDLKDSLEKDQKELESKQVEYEKQGDNLNNLITSKSAEVANQYLKKGSKVLLEGRLIFEQWTVQDGSTRSRHSLRVDTLKMLDSKNESISLTKDEKENQIQTKKEIDLDEIPNDIDDCPF